MKGDDLQDTLDDDFGFAELFNLLWLNKKFIFMSTGFFAFISLIYSLSLTNIYTSQILVVPTSDVNKPAISFGLASVAGINIESSPDVTLALAFIESKKIVRQLSKYESFLPDLIAAKEWDKGSNSIIYDENIYDNKNKTWVKQADSTIIQVPSEQRAYSLFRNKIKISEDKRRYLITLSVDHISPTVSQQWAKWIINEANSMVANLRVEEARSSINYLNDQIKLSPYAELRTMFFNLIQQNTQNMMLAKVNKQYALTIIDPAVIPESPSHPQRFITFILGTLFGCALSILIIFVWKYFFKKDSELDILKLSSKLLAFYKS